MKKIFVVVMVIGLMLTSLSTVMAGGDKNRGETGIGTTIQVGCENQPCFEDAPKSDSLVAPDLFTELNETELDQISGYLTGHK